MKIYDRYLFKNLLIGLFAGIALYSIMFLIQNLFVLSEIIVEQHADPRQAIQFTLAYFPKIIGTTFPFAVLFASTLTAGSLAGNSELVVVNATGASIFRQARPYVLLGVLSLVVLALLEFHVVPFSKRMRDDIYGKIVRDAAIFAQQPGAFAEVGPGYFMRFEADREIDGGRKLERISLYSRVNDRVSWTTAESGVIRTETHPTKSQNADQKEDLHSSPVTERVLLELMNGLEYHVSGRADRVSRLAYQRKTISIPLEEFGIDEDDIYTVKFHEMMPFPALMRTMFDGDRRSLVLFLSRMLLVLFVGLSPLIAFVLGFKLQRGSGFSGAFLISFSLGLGVITVAELMEGAFVRNQSNAILWYTCIYSCLMLIVFLRLRKLQRCGRGSQTEKQASTSAPGKFINYMKKRYIERFRTASSAQNKVLMRYTVTGFLRMFLMALLALEGLYILIMTLKYLPKALENKEIASLILPYVGFSVPATLVYAIPLSFVIAALFYVSMQAQRHELTAMKSVGLSIYQVLTPIFWLSVCASLVLMFCTTYLSPYAAAKSNALRYEIKMLRGKVPSRSEAAMASPMSVENERLVFARLLNREGDGEAPAPLVAFYLDENGSGVEWIYLHPNMADGGGGRWMQMSDVSNRPDLPEIETLVSSAQVLGADARPVEQVTSYHLLKRIQKRKAEGIKPWGDITAYYQRFAAALSPLIVLLIGLPAMFRKTGRQVRPGLGIMAGLLLVVTYYALSALFHSMGAVHFLPPFLAAWMVNLLFSTIGLLSYTAIRT